MAQFYLLAAIVTAALALGSPTARSDATPDASLAFSVQADGKTFGLVGFGLIPSNFRESTGDTLGGIGSAIALRQGSFKANHDGTFSGTLVVQPDRGFNVLTTINYQGRQHDIDFVLSPYYGAADLTFNQSQKTLNVTYKRTLLYKDRFGVKTSGLDPLGVRAAELGYPLVALADPIVPIPNSSFSHLSMDNEGLVLNADGTFWVSDEYGPYVYRFDALGNLLQAIQPPAAILPRIDGQANFTSSATVQDGGDDKTTSRYTRLLAYDITAPLLKRPDLVAEYVVPLPQSKKNKTFAASEIHFVSEGVFLVLSRDGNGHGDDDSESSYKGIDLVMIGDATDIHGSKFDNALNPIAVNGTLNSQIKPVTYIPFVDMLNSTQLARFGLHNGDPVDATLIDGKWESIALAPVGDPKFPHDFFLFTAADNDFLTTDGISLGVPYNAGLDNDNQFLVYRVTLPTAQ
ncbi:hypothetical protein PHLGIDRAFT_128612 [Phlebiopsis gigantea 11061_1 CR5-6]|uniref:Phytase-like domain-containing protein n=1 Tax=Phlebiopsis gigantea (strain 11061_1 CR5-6) TaxID=745531 RepID=A0A0C3RWG3_PHLG1|nr:hypothetical protein PHLGIDRAFT_128612 [Phlebiopsis gigantea 11061_1 CR5-6]